MTICLKDRLFDNQGEKNKLEMPSTNTSVLDNFSLDSYNF